MVYAWMRLTREDVGKLKKLYGEAFPEFRLIQERPFTESDPQILQLCEKGWLRTYKSFSVFLSYAPTDMKPFITFTSIGENSEGCSDCAYFSEIDYCNREAAKSFRRILKKQGLRFKTCYTAIFNERKHPIPKSELEERVKKLILNLAGIG